MTHPKKSTRRRKVLALVFLTALIGGGVAAMTALNINSELFPAVGDEGVNACDEDGINVAYTYGNASNNGIKVSGVNVTGVSATCTTGQVYFLNGQTVVNTYNGTVTSNAMSVPTNVWTFDFDTVRVVLFP
jgi:hypothetical protein